MDTAARRALCVLTIAALCVSMESGNGEDVKLVSLRFCPGKKSGQVAGVQGRSSVVVVLVVDTHRQKVVLVDVVDVEVVVIVVVVDVVLVDVDVVVVTVVFVVVLYEVVDWLLVVVVGLQSWLLGSAGLIPSGHMPGVVQLPLLEQASQQVPQVKGGRIPAPATADAMLPMGSYLHTKTIPAA